MYVRARAVNLSHRMEIGIMIRMINDFDVLLSNNVYVSMIQFNDIVIDII